MGDVVTVNKELTKPAPGCRSELFTVDFGGEMFRDSPWILQQQDVYNDPRRDRDKLREGWNPQR